MDRATIRQGAVLAVAAFGLACPVSAHSIELVLDTIGPAQNVEFTLNGTPTSGAAGIASWTRTGKTGDDWLPVTIASFSVEVTQNPALGKAHTYDMVDVAEIQRPTLKNQRLGVEKVSELAELWGRHFNKIVNHDTAAAFQMAVWEIAYDDDRDLSNGIFQALQAQGAWPAYVAMAQDWLNSIDGYGPKMVLLGLSNSDFQDQITTVDSIVDVTRLPPMPMPKKLPALEWPDMPIYEVPTPTSLSGGLMMFTVMASGQLLRRRRRE